MIELFQNIDETTTALVQYDADLFQVKLQQGSYEVCIPLESFAKVTIGRHRDNVLTIADPSVSRVHCEIESNKNGIFISERASLNSTFVNNQKVSGFQVLAPGDTIQVGNQKILLLGNQNKICLQEIPADGFVAIYSKCTNQGQLWRELITTLGWPTIRIFGTPFSGSLPHQLIACGQTNIKLIVADVACFLQDNNPETMTSSNQWPYLQSPLLATYNPELKSFKDLSRRACEWGFTDLVKALDDDLDFDNLVIRLQALPWLAEAALNHRNEIINLFCLKHKA
jgi:FHA domain